MKGDFHMITPSQLNPEEARKLIRVMDWDNPTAGMANGYIAKGAGL
jgi:uncharacterized protein YcsI (UPF0317 family)